MGSEWREGHREGAQVSTRQRDRALSTLARHRHRVVTTAELLRIGFSRREISGRVAAGHLVHKYRSVYVVGPGALSDRGEWLAAALFAAPDGVVSHRDAACLAQLIENGSAGGIIHVTCPRRISPPQKLRAHQAQLRRDEWTILHGVPTTTSGRTLLDCAALGATPRDIERMVNEAFVKNLPIRPSIAEILARHPAHGLPRPLCNHDVETHIGALNVDCVWPEQRVAIELDAPSTHGSRPRMLRDRRRDRALILAGWTPGRLMEEDLLEEEALVREMTCLLDP